eukprot:CAMPEP_0114580478 /NCGR_PEP_ID=MMETSP0125-20121206/4753_1 /TAXON_ID=485358 ORGANISM="Aristerostoma sp., Strain ATCC 50986" /NCGR_SAMPLE_ID=MMETSP0125 /ASSEMBLY_ACC=CAM_ASM_000245 /LENGTH=139 /DNA_ID=CAMNT_0001772059 /DNA_START=137 /DNA_END=556 /DNA_ORIENTATION=+
MIEDEVPKSKTLFPTFAHPNILRILELYHQNPQGSQNEQGEDLDADEIESLSVLISNQAQCDIVDMKNMINVNRATDKKTFVLESGEKDYADKAFGELGSIVKFDKDRPKLNINASIYYSKNNILKELFGNQGFLGCVS